MSGTGERSTYPRRTILAGGLGGLVAIALEAIGRPRRADAADGDVVKVGSSVSGTGETAIVSTGTPAIQGQTSATGTGLNNAGAGVVGYASAGQGYNIGVRGISLGAIGVGVVGQSLGANGFGVDGISNTGIGVHGRSGSNTAVRGESDTSRGMWGSSPSGVGVLGSSDSGVGVLASATTGRALSVAGKAQFSRSGRTNVPAGKSFVDITVDGGLDSTASVLATLQLYRPGVSVAAVRVSYPTAGKARIYLTKVASTAASTPVSWLVLD